MSRTFAARFFARATLASLLVLVCFSFVGAKDEMTSSLQIGNARIEIRIEGSPPRLPTKDIFRWVQSAAESVTAYYGRFPVPYVLIRITPFEGRGVRNGMTFGDRGGGITIRVCRHTSPSEFASYWIPPPQMVPFAFPPLAPKPHSLTN